MSSVAGVHIPKRLANHGAGGALSQVDQVEEALAFVSGMLKQAETTSRPVAQFAAHFAAALMVVFSGMGGA